MIHTILGSEGRAQRTTPQPTPAKSAGHRQNYAARFVHSSGPLRLKSDPNQRSSGHPRIATTRIATIGVPIATMTARIACQWVRSNQSTTQSLRTNSGSFSTLAAMQRGSSRQYQIHGEAACLVASELCEKTLGLLWHTLDDELTRL